MASRRFQSLRSSDAAKAKNDELREAYSGVYKLVKDVCPDTERRRIALEEIESSFMWATKCVSRANIVDTEDSRSGPRSSHCN